jgi:hypothetical protein
MVEYDIEEFNNNLSAYINCYLEKCRKEKNAIKKAHDILGDRQIKLRELYEKGIIKYDKYIAENNKAFDKFYNSKVHKTLTQCKLDKCYDLAKKNLDGMLKRMGYPIQESYNVAAVIKILKLNNDKIIYPIWEIKK